MPVCVPIKDMRDTAKFSELVESTPGPITVTKNGYSKFVVMRSVDYDRMSRSKQGPSYGASRDCGARAGGRFRTQRL